MDAWNKLISTLPNPHALQTSEWAQVKARYGWLPLHLAWTQDGRLLRLEENSLPDSQTVQAAALVLQRSITLGGFAARLRVLYAPKGPLLDWEDAALRTRVLDGLRQVARQQGAIFIKIDPDVALGYGLPGLPGSTEAPHGSAWAAELIRGGWRYSDEQIQFRNTVLIDLRPGEDELLAGMKQKTRYNIRLAQKKGVSVRAGSQDDLPLLYRMYAETSVRDGFVIRDEGYYRLAWSTFIDAGMGQALIAQVGGEPVAAVILFHFGGRGWYIYGMSREAQREKMPNYLLQWEAMRYLKAVGCQSYDLWGAPEQFDESDALWGVYRFKEGLGGSVVRGLGAWDLPTQPLLYRLYTQTLPRLLDVLRRRGKAQTRAAVGGA